VSLSSLGVAHPYFLNVGNAYPHKNLSFMLEAFAKFCKTDQQTMLVLAGKRDMFVERLEKESRELGIGNRVKCIDTPTDAILARLYADAALVISPSRIEGFGIPPLEALSFGTPVAAAHASSLPEVLKNTVRYFDPDDLNGLIRFMHEAIVAPEMWSALREPGKKQAASFSWETTAKTMKGIYLSYADRRR
jgi:glycosyltransferase involved in cell wall biosynthesis